MRLKEDYKDPLYDGARRYRITPNADGSSAIVDDTRYTQAGDQFGASDINAINGTVNKAINQRTITLTASGWSASYPYAQTVSVPGITADDNLKIIGVNIPDGSTIDQVKAINKAAGFLMHSPGGVGADSVTFKAYKKPVIDFTITTEGG